jgi:hypothetical protein
VKLEDLEPGRRLDLIVAEEVMGWRWISGSCKYVSAIYSGEQTWLLPPDVSPESIDLIDLSGWRYYSEDDDPEAGFTFFWTPEWSSDMSTAYEVIQTVRTWNHSKRLRWKEYLAEEILVRLGADYDPYDRETPLGHAAELALNMDPVDICKAAIRACRPYQRSASRPKRGKLR